MSRPEVYDVYVTYPMIRIGEDSRWHTLQRADSHPGLRGGEVITSITTRCGRTVVPGSESVSVTRGMVRASEYPGCDECRDLPPFWPG